jgi:hypothetical protein
VFAPNHRLRPAVTALAIGNIGKRPDAAPGGYAVGGHAAGGDATGGGSDSRDTPRSHATSQIACAEFVQIHDDHNVLQASPVELPVIDIRSL